VSVWWPRPKEKRATYAMVTPPMYAQSMATDYSAVDLSAPTASLQAVACWSSIDLLASLASELPVDVFRGKGKSKEQLEPPSNVLDPGGDGHGVEDWMWQGMISWLLTGNLVGEIIGRDVRSGFPMQVALTDPGQVSADRVDGRIDWTLGGRPVPDASNVYHRRVYPWPGAVLGLSPIQYHATTLGLSIAVERFGASYFTNNATPSGLLTNDDEEISEPRAKTVKSKFMNAIRGTREPAVLGKGWKYQALSIAPEESQFLETNQFTAAQCARIYGPGVPEVLGYDSGGSLTYATVEGRSLHLLVYTLNKWLNRCDRLLSSLTPRGQYVKLNRNALLSTTTIERFRAYTMALQGQWTTPNEVREKEDMKPVEWGDEPLSAIGAPEPDAGEGDVGKTATGTPAAVGAGGGAA